MYLDAVNHAIGQWSSNGGVRILPDVLSTWQDLYFYDIKGNCLDWYGAWDESAGADDIFFNVSNIQGDLTYWDPNCRTSPAVPEAVAAHELGHAMGFAHNPGVPDGGVGAKSVMVAPNAQWTTLNLHDRSDLDAKW